jgi:hypothetical protein
LLSNGAAVAARQSGRSRFGDLVDHPPGRAGHGRKAEITIVRENSSETATPVSGGELQPGS